MHRAAERTGSWRLAPVVILVCGLTSLSAGAAQQGQDPASEPPTDSPKADAGAPPRSPYEAYDRGLYDQALEAFVDRQVERPEDAELLLNIGSVHYKMRDYGAAEEAFIRAATGGDEDVRAQALYNLGNTAYRQGKLDEAVQRYQAVLDLHPDDEDAKFNLEFVRDEIRRRHEEAQKRQQQGEGEQQQQQEQSQPQSGQDQQSQEQQQPGEQPQEEAGDQQQDRQQAGQQEAPEDRDGDGLGDELERTAANPTNPDDSDSDDDGLLDGEEDRNHNGQLDEGETDPNRADSDGDGTPDGEEQGQGSSASQAMGGEQLEGMSEEEAERYLQALEEGRPQNRPARPGRRLRVEKDW